MKHRGCCVECAKERNKELMDAYCRILGNAKYIDRTTLFAQVATAPCSRFWVSEERATYVMTLLQAGKSIAYMQPKKQEMFHEIHRRYLSLRALEPERTMSELMVRIIHQPAPSFYLLPRTAEQLVYRIMNRKRKHRAI